MQETFPEMAPEKLDEIFITSLNNAAKAKKIESSPEPEVPLDPNTSNGADELRSTDSSHSDSDKLEHTQLTADDISWMATGYTVREATRKKMMEFMVGGYLPTEELFHSVSG
jgi:hypothetical protein